MLLEGLGAVGSFREATWEWEAVSSRLSGVMAEVLSRVDSTKDRAVGSSLSSHNR
jgi:hypothetical protein